MRYYLEEQADMKWPAMKQYILDIKDFTKEALIEEIIKNIQFLRPDQKYPFDYNWIKSEKTYYDTFDNLSLMAVAFEEKFYIFDDQEEHLWNKEVIQNVINNKPWIHRWDNTEIL